jgi:hypothetical protein
MGSILFTVPSMHASLFCHWSLISVSISPAVGDRNVCGTKRLSFCHQMLNEFPQVIISTLNALQSAEDEKNTQRYDVTAEIIRIKFMSYLHLH